MHTKPSCLCSKIHISQGGYHWIRFPKGQGDHHRSMDKEHGMKSPFPPDFLPWIDSLPAWLRLGCSLTIAVEERKHHVAHVVRELHLGHRPGHLLHGHCNRGRAQGHTGLRMCQPSRRLLFLHGKWPLCLQLGISLINQAAPSDSIPRMIL